jgi:four helix bundle protein
VSDFRKLKVWQKAHVMAINVHTLAGNIRGTKHASLRSQMIRASLSVPTNLVEGCGQRSAREYSRFVRIALNSTSELEYHLLVARDLGATSAQDSLTLVSQVIEVRKMLYGLVRYLNSGKDEKPEVESNLPGPE